MAVPPNARSISPDSLSSDDVGQNLEELLQQLNPILTNVSAGMNKGLSLTENLNCVQKDFIVHTPDAQWTAPTLVNSWVNYDTGANSLAGYRIDEDGVVHLKGTVKTGVPPSVVFTLPTGYRPPGISHYAVTSNDAFGSVNIGTDGTVTAQVGSATWLALDGINFSATLPAAPPAFAGKGWPYLIDSGQTSPIMDVKLVSIRDLNAGSSFSNGGGGLDWEPGPAGKVVLRKISRLTPNRQYSVRVLLFPQY